MGDGVELMLRVFDGRFARPSWPWIVSDPTGGRRSTSTSCATAPARCPAGSVGSWWWSRPCWLRPSTVSSGCIPPRPAYTRARKSGAAVVPHLRFAGARKRHAHRLSVRPG